MTGRASGDSNRLNDRRLGAFTAALGPSAGMLALALALAPTTARAAAFTSAAEAPIRAALDALDAGDRKRFARNFTADAAILDEISPFRFDGAGAWFDRLTEVNRQNGIAHEHSHVGSLRSASVEGDAAYATVPARIDYRQKGRAVVEDGTWTFVLRNVAGRWMITGASWAPSVTR